MPPGSRTFLSTEEFGATYGAAPAELDQVAAFARSYGLTVTETNVGRQRVLVSGTAAQMSRAFAVELGRYESPTETHRGYDGYVHLPNDVADLVVSVCGLDNRRLGATDTHPNSVPPGTFPLDVLTVAMRYKFPNSRAPSQMIGIFAISQPAIPPGQRCQRPISTAALSAARAYFFASNCAAFAERRHRGRGVPDVAGNASASSGYQLWLEGSDRDNTGQPFLARGTSIVAPLYAGLAAVINQNLPPFIFQGQSIPVVVGFLNPILYRFPGNCNDVNDQLFTGAPPDNGLGDPSRYPSGPAWDACTGLGTIDGKKLQDLLIHSAVLNELLPGGRSGYRPTRGT
jgi:subtilase family serine protease